jgi:hypothetical protein
VTTGSSLQASTTATAHNGGPPASRNDKMATAASVGVLGLLKEVKEQKMWRLRKTT